VAFLLSLVLTGCRIGGTDGAVFGQEDRGTASERSSSPDGPGTGVAPQTPAAVSAGGLPLSGPVTFDEAEGLYRERRYEAAFDGFAAYVSRRPENAWGHYMLGLSAWKAGDLVRAESALTRAVEIDPGHVKGWLNLTRVLLESGQPGQALESANRARELDSTSSGAYRLIGRAHADLGERTEAMISYRRAIALDDKDVWALNNLGVVLIAEDQTSQALGPLARAVDLAPDQAAFHNNLGMALERCGYFAAAADQYRLAVEDDSTHSKAAANLERIQGRRDRDGLPALDLPLLAREFLESVRR
jgi:superkiller protein 3